MICSSCRQRLFSRIPSFSRSNATLTTISAPTSTLPSHSNAITRQTRRQPYSSAPTAPTSHSSPSTTQPLTAPLSSSHPSPNTSSTPSADPETPNTPPPTPIPDLPISSVPGGEPLKGLAYLKNKPQILAMEDDQYPPWLWTILDDSKDGASSGVDEVGLEKVDLNALTKKQRSKHMKKRQALLSILPKKVPPHEQSTDLTGPGASPVEHLEKRQEVVKSAREARRKGVRERNYLGGM